MRIFAIQTAIVAFVLLVASTASSVNASPPQSSFAAELSPEAQRQWELAQRALAATEWEALKTAVDQLLQLAPDYAPGYHFFSIARSAEEMKQATDRLRSRAECSPSVAVAWYAYGRVESDRVKSEAAFARVVELEPSAPWGYVGLASRARAVKEPDKALALYETAYGLAPKEPSVLSGLATACAETPGRMALARWHLEELVAIAPSAYATDSAFRTVLFETDDPAEQAALAERYIKAFPEGIAVGSAYYYALSAQRKKDPAVAAARATAALAATRTALFPTSDRKPLVDEIERTTLLNFVNPDAPNPFDTLVIGRTDDEIRFAPESAPLPVAAFTALDGRRVSLADYRGKVVVINFWSPGCLPCRAEMPHLKALSKKYRDQGVEVVLFETSGEHEAARKFLRQIGIAVTSLKGDWETAARLFRVTSTPTSLVVDGQGRVLFWELGYDPSKGTNRLAKVVEAALLRPGARK